MGISAVATWVANGFGNYVDSMPRDWKRQSVKAFTVSFLWNTLSSVNPVYGLQRGLAAVMATTVHAAISPLFGMVIGADRPLEWDEEMLRGSIALIASYAVLGVCGDEKALGQLSSQVSWYGVTALCSDSSRDLKTANWF